MSRRPSEIALSLVCSATVQVWWMMNAKSAADHSRHETAKLRDPYVIVLVAVAL